MSLRTPLFFGWLCPRRSELLPKTEKSPLIELVRTLDGGSSLCILTGLRLLA